MPITTTYGTWANQVGGALSLRSSVVIALGSFCDDFDVDRLVDAFESAINKALPDEVTLHGGVEFIGPYNRPADGWGDYQTTVEGALDIKAIVGGVDFWKLAERYEVSDR